MRRLARHLFTLCSGASLLLCVTAGALWVRSRDVADDMQWIRPPHRVPPVGGPGAPGTAVRYWRLGSHTDGVTAGMDLLVWGHSDLRPLPRSFDRYSGPAAPFADAHGTVWRRVPVLGVRLAAADHPTDGLRRRRWTVVVPHGLLVVVFALWPATWLVGRARRLARRRRHAIQGRCVRCGYDLRDSPGRCPECGASTGSRLEHTAIGNGPSTGA